jgi:hypothetical protein
MKILSILFFLVCFGTNAQDCDRFKTGTFEVDNMDGTVSVIKRTKKYQSESNGDIKVKDKIVWLSDCSYKLIPVKTDKKLGDIAELELVFTIVKTFDHSYIVEITGVPDMVIEARVYEEGYLEESQK